MFVNCGVVLDVPIGSVEVAANREALSLDDRTKKNAQHLFDSAQKEMSAHIQKTIDAAKTWIEAEKILQKWKDVLNLGYTRYQWQGIELTGYIGIEDMKLKFYNAYNWNEENKYFHAKWPLESLPKLRFIIDDTTKKVVRKRIRVKEFTGNRRDYRPDIYIILKDVTSQEIDKIVETLALDRSKQIIFVADLPDVKPVKVISAGPAYVPTKRTGTYRYTGWGKTVYGSNHLVNLTEADIEKEFYWVPLDKGTDENVYLPNSGSMRTDNVWNMYQFAIAVFKLEDKPLYFLTKMAQNKANDAFNFEEVIKSMMTNKKSEIEETYKYYYMFTILDQKMDKDSSSTIHKLLGNLHPHFEVNNFSQRMQQFASLGLDKIDLSSIASTATKECDILVQEFPLLFTGTDEIFKQYIDNQKKLKEKK